MKELHSIEADKVNLSDFDEIIDVRSPLEYEEDSLPSALNIPVLNNKERELVGTIYKQESPFEARRKGAAIISHNIATHLREHFFDKTKNYSCLVYCWRGGERSRSLATILNRIGWRTVLLEGGYQAYRKKIVNDLKNKLTHKHLFKIISGFTGSGKTRLLSHLHNNGSQVLDLEGIASHKGSALGDVIALKQPSQKKFERKILESLEKLNPSKITYLESESSRIGSLQIPACLWSLMKASPVIEINASICHRADFLLEEYEYFIKSPESLLAKLTKIKHLVPQKVYDTWLDLIVNKDFKNFVLSILEKHYDPAYSVSRRNTYSQPTENVYKLDRINDTSLNKLAVSILTTSKQ